MSRPSDIYSKTLSVRLPMDSYIKVLKKASSMELSVSEYITLKLFDENNDNSIINNENDVSKDNKKQKNKWILVDTFSDKSQYKHPVIKNIPSIKKGSPKISKDGKYKIVAVKKGLNEVYKLEE